MLKSAPMATEPASMRRLMRTPRDALRRTALTGVWVFVFTRFQMRERGKQSSRA